MKTETKTLVKRLIRKGENESIQILETLLNSQNLLEDLPSRMMRTLKPYQPYSWAMEHFNKGNKIYLYNEIKQFIETVEFISNLKWMQDTSDWKPRLIIETVGEQTFTSEPGSYHMEAHNLETMEGSLTIELDDFDFAEDGISEDECYITLDIKDITKITFTKTLPI